MVGSQYRLPTITVEREHTGNILISDDVTRNYGIGKTFIEAVKDYYESLREWEILAAKECEEP